MADGRRAGPALVHLVPVAQGLARARPGPISSGSWPTAYRCRCRLIYAGQMQPHPSARTLYCGNASCENKSGRAAPSP